ncbi:MAG TPA: hypothetical protein VJU78_11745 [Chitinophagaceae bacterium]|nr:hypothetical protein [Chitinophagaceae bacterium]
MENVYNCAVGEKHQQRRKNSAVGEAIARSNAQHQQRRKMAKNLITKSVETGVFSFLCILDGVRAIDSTEEKGNLLLHFEKNGITTWLNNPDENYLHDLL